MRVSVTDLEAFRRLQTEDWMTDQKFQSQLRREPFSRTPEMAFGQSIHAAIEAFVMSEGALRMEGEILDRVLSGVKPGGVLELKGTVEVDVGGETVTVVGKADHVVGTGIFEHKTRWRAFDHDDYAESHQWRWYVRLFGAQWVTYNVFVLSNTERAGLRLVDVATPTFYPYADVVADTDRLLQDFVGYIHERGLERYVADREATP